MKKAIVILAHPNLEESIANKGVIAQLQAHVPNIEIRDLTQLYPDFKIDVEKEQQVLVESDIIVFQFPWYWYSAPAILKQYMDMVLAFNFAYGPKGDKLRGKQFIASTTVGGAETMYAPGGPNHFYIDTLLAPFEEMALKCGMIWNRAVRSHKMVYVPNTYHTKEGVSARARVHGEELAEKINSLINFSEETHIKNFITEKWFPGCDRMEENGYFIPHVAGNAQFNFNGEAFVGHQGFIDWFEGMRNIIKPGNSHVVEKLDIHKTSQKDVFKIYMELVVKGDTHTGATFHEEVAEFWNVRILPDHTVMIEEYFAKPREAHSAA